MNVTSNIERLEWAVAHIAGHVDMPEKPVAVSVCLDEIEARYEQGSLDLAQKRRLVALLLGLRPAAATAAMCPASGE
jgi:hypothetical protein